MIKTAVLSGVEPIDRLLLARRRIVLLPDLPDVQSSFSLLPHTSTGVGHISCCIALTFNEGQKIFSVMVEERVAFCHLSN